MKTSSTTVPTGRRGVAGLAQCPGCERVFLTKSGIHTWCSESCRREHYKPRPKTDKPRAFACLNCGAEGVAGRGGPLPRRCEPCKALRDKQTNHLRYLRRMEAKNGRLDP